MCITESLCYRAEINTTLEINYSPIKLRGGKEFAVWKYFVWQYYTSLKHKKRCVTSLVIKEIKTIRLPLYIH